MARREEKDDLLMTNDDDDACGHVQWKPLLDNQGAPVLDEHGNVKHWICFCGVIVPDPVDPHPEESLDLFMEEMVRASREFLATPIGDHETAAMTELRRGLQASIDEYDRSKDR
jgi:hypothetical protein